MDAGLIEGNRTVAVATRIISIVGVALFAAFFVALAVFRDT